MSLRETVEKLVKKTGADAFTLRVCRGPHVEPVHRHELFVVLDKDEDLVHYEAVENKGKVKIKDTQTLYVYNPVDLDSTDFSSANDLS